MIEMVISLAMAFGITQHGNTVKIDAATLSQIEKASGIDAEVLVSTNGYNVIHLNKGLLIVATEQNGSGK